VQDFSSVCQLDVDLSALEIYEMFDTLHCWLAKIKHWTWRCTTWQNIN